MNNIRRKALQRAYDLLDEAKLIVIDVANEEQEAFDNLPEGLQASDRGSQMEDNAYNLGEAEDAIDSAMELVEGAME